MTLGAPPVSPTAQLRMRPGWLLLGLLVVAALHSWLRRESIDFAVFYRAGSRVLEARDLYQTGDGEFPFKYAPIVAFVFGPFALLPARLARLLWSLLSAVALFQVMRWSARNAVVSSPWIHVVAVGVLLPVILFLFALGQCDALLIWLMMESESRAEPQPLVSAGAWAMAVLFKPPFLIFVPWAVLRRQWSRLIWVLLGVVIGLILPAARFGWSGNLAQLRAWQSIHQATGPHMLCGVENQGLFGIICSYAANPANILRFWVSLAATALLITAGCVCFALRIKKTEERSALILALVFYGSVLFSPLAWRSNLLALAPLVYLVAVTTWQRAGSPRLLGVVALAGWVAAQLITRELLGPSRYVLLMGARMLGLLTLAGVLIGTIAIAIRSREAAPTFDR